MIVLSVVILHFSLFLFFLCSYPVFFSVYSCVHYIGFFVYLLLLLSPYTLIRTPLLISTPVSVLPVCKLYCDEYVYLYVGLL
jgi:hypothetical protein